LRHAGLVLALTVCGFFAYLIAVAPHLVHHAFETDHGRPTCPLLLASQQATADGHLNPAPLAVPRCSGILDARSPMASPSSLSAPRLQPRAPPGLTAVVQAVSTPRWNP
jgi:hypothetical protein